MTGLFEALSVALVAACFVTGLGSLYYVLWFAFRRRDAAAKVRSVDGWARREARWGLPMASPLLVAVRFARAVGRRDRASALDHGALNHFYASTGTLAREGISHE